MEANHSMKIVGKNPPTNTEYKLDTVTNEPATCLKKPGGVSCWYILLPKACENPDDDVFDIYAPEYCGDVVYHIRDGRSATLTIKTNSIILAKLPSTATSTTANTTKVTIKGPITIDLRTGTVFECTNSQDVSHTRFSAKFIPRTFDHVWFDYDEENPSFLNDIHCTSDLFGELIDRAYPERFQPGKQCHISESCQSAQIVVCADPPKSDNSLPDHAIFVEPDTVGRSDGRLSFWCQDLKYPQAERDCRNYPGSYVGNCMCEEQEMELCSNMYIDIVLMCREATH